MEKPPEIIQISGEDLAAEVDALTDYAEERDVDLFLAAAVVVAYGMAKGETLDAEGVQKVLMEFMEWVGAEEKVN